jgi:hypothetical protein
MILDIGFLDDATRPTVPKLEGVTPAQRAAGEHLRDVHDHIRGELQTVKVLIQRASTGLVSKADIAAEADKLAMVANLRRFGALCGQYCALVEMHHSLEDYHMLPSVAAISDGYRKVADRLRAEHGVVHELLERQVAAIETLAAQPTLEHFTEATEIFDALERVLLSHLGYEEDQIGDALGYYGLI